MVIIKDSKSKEISSLTITNAYTKLGSWSCKIKNLVTELIIYIIYIIYIIIFIIIIITILMC